MPWVDLQCMIVVFPDHTHLLLAYLVNGNIVKINSAGVGRVNNYQITKETEIFDTIELHTREYVYKIHQKRIAKLKQISQS